MKKGRGATKIKQVQLMEEEEGGGGGNFGHFGIDCSRERKIE